MAKTITASELLEHNIEKSFETDEKGNKFIDLGAVYTFDGIPVKDLLEAQQNAIKGGTIIVSGGTDLSGTTIIDETGDVYREWEHIVEG